MNNYYIEIDADTADDMGAFVDEADPLDDVIDASIDIREQAEGNEQ